MPYQIRYVEKYDLVETLYMGSMSIDEVQTAAMDTLRTAQAHQTLRLLGDCLQLEGGASLFDIYELASLFEAVPQARFFKEAIILPTLPKPLEEMQFYETTTRNRGFNVRVFTDRDEAIAWLLEA